MSGTKERIALIVNFTYFKYVCMHIFCFEYGYNNSTEFQNFADYCLS